MNYPEDLKYTKEHEWVRIVDEKTALVGITHFAQGELGELVYVDVESVGETLAKDEIFGALEAVKTTADLFMPISGKIIEFNPKLDENEGDEPALINSDPYGEGWIIRLEIHDPSEFEELMDAAAYTASFE